MTSSLFVTFNQMGSSYVESNKDKSESKESLERKLCMTPLL